MANIILVLWWLISILGVGGGCLFIVRDWNIYHMKKMTTKRFVTGLIIYMLFILFFVGNIIVSFVLVDLDIIPIKFSLYR